MKPERFGTLYVVATPIGNLEDLSERARKILEEIDHWVVEDTRRTAKLRDQLKISSGEMTSYYDEVESIRVDPLIDQLKRGENLVLVTDAGTPAIQDPGQLLVERSHREGIGVRPVPGPSSVIAALSVSGFPAEPFLFQGYFPRRQKQRRDFLLRIKYFEGSVVIMESPKRIHDCLDVIRSYLGNRKLFLAREMTKQYEEYLRGSPAEVQTRLQDKPKGEITLVLAPGEEESRDPGEYLKELLDRGVQLKEAARAAAFFSEQSKSELYQKGLEYEDD